MILNGWYNQKYAGILDKSYFFLLLLFTVKQKTDYYKTELTPIFLSFCSITLISKRSLKEANVENDSW